MSNNNTNLILLEKICKTHPDSCNGICDEITFECICEDGYENDFTFFRYNSCSLPINLSYIVHIITIILCIIAQILIILFFRNKKSYLKTIITAATVCNLSILVAAIVHIVLNGTSFIYWFALSVGICNAGIGFTTYLYSFFHILYKTSAKEFPKQQMDTMFYLSVSLISLPFFTIALPASIAFGTLGIDTLSPESYNNCIAIAIGLLPVQLLVTMPLLVNASKKLIYFIEDTLSKTQKLTNNHDSVNSSSSPKNSTPKNINKNSFFKNVLNKNQNNQNESRIRNESNASHSSSLSTIKNQQVTNDNNDKLRGVVYRLKLFRIAMVYIIAPSETIFCVGIAILHFIFRFQYLYVIYLLLLVTFVSTVYSFLVAAGFDKKSKSSSSVSSNKNSLHPSTTENRTTENRTSENRTLSVNYSTVVSQSHPNPGS